MRRKLLIALGASALTVPFASVAQQKGKLWRIGFLGAGSRRSYGTLLDAFKAGMRELEYAENRDYTIEYRTAEDKLEQLPALAAELVALKVDLILTPATQTALDAQKATREIPIVVTVAGDPVRAGFAASLARPGGNVTGLTNVSVDLAAKRLELIRELFGRARQVGFVHNPDNVVNRLALKELESAATKLGMRLLPVAARNGSDLPGAFQMLIGERVDAVFVPASTPNTSLVRELVELASKHRLPALYGLSEFVESGGLISYSANWHDQYRRASIYVDKIFKGAKPGDLPIEQPMKFDLVINMKTAKALGLTIPPSVMVRTTKVIE